VLDSRDDVRIARPTLHPVSLRGNPQAPPRDPPRQARNAVVPARSAAAEKKFFHLPDSAAVRL